MPLVVEWRFPSLFAHTFAHVLSSFPALAMIDHEKDLEPIDRLRNKEGKVRVPNTMVL